MEASPTDKMPFPKEFSELNYEAHFARYSKGGRLATWMIVLLVLGTMAALPFIKIDVVFQSRAMLRTIQPPLTLTAASAGYLKEINLRNGMYVSRGDTLAVLDHREIQIAMEEVRFNLTAAAQKHAAIGQMLQGAAPATSGPYQAAYGSYIRKLEIATRKEELMGKAFLRQRSLYQGAFISKEAFEAAEQEVQQAQLEREMVVQDQKSRWQLESDQLRERIARLKSSMGRLEKEMESHFILAQASGYIADFSAFATGSYLPAGAGIARIVPDNALLGMCMIPTDKVGFLQRGQAVKLAIDNYPPSLFGRMEGRVQNISKDAVASEGSAGYPVEIELLAPGSINSKGAFRLTSGMTCTAYFITGKRTLWQLLVEKGERLYHQNRLTSNDQQAKNRR